VTFPESTNHNKILGALLAGLIVIPDFGEVPLIGHDYSMALHIAHRFLIAVLAYLLKPEPPPPAFPAL